MPLLAGGLLELPLGLLAGEGRRRRLAVLGGGALFVLTLLGVASAGSFAVLLAAFIAFYPASGAFVSLTQAELMDATPHRQAQVMARWELAGATGAVAGPLLLAAVLASGGGWRAAYLVLAGASAVTWLATCLRGPLGVTAAAVAPAGAAGGSGEQDRSAAEAPAGGSAEEDGQAGGPARGPARGPAGNRPWTAGGPAGSRPWTARAREVAAALRSWGTLRWLILLEVADLLVDVLTGFVALYLVDVAHLSPATAALAVAVRLGAALAGNVVLLGVLERTGVLERAGDLAVLRASAGAAALLYPGFLLVPGAVPKLVILAVLSAATAPWYPLLQARLYGSLPGRSPVAVTLSSAAGLAGGLGPLAVGLVAQAFGLPWALAGLAVVPVAVLLVTLGAGREEAGVTVSKIELKVFESGRASRA